MKARIYAAPAVKGLNKLDIHINRLLWIINPRRKSDANVSDNTSKGWESRKASCQWGVHGPVAGQVFNLIQ